MKFLDKVQQSQKLLDEAFEEWVKSDLHHWMCNNEYDDRRRRETAKDFGVVSTRLNFILWDLRSSQKYMEEEHARV